MNLKYENFSTRLKRLVNSGIFAIGKFCKKHSKLTALVLVVMVVFVVNIVFVSTTHAVDFTALITQGLTWIILQISTLFGYMLGLVFKLLIVVASYDNLVGTEQITHGWVIVRDLCNMIIVVLMLIYAFATIVGMEGKVLSGGKSAIVNLLLVALLINFSRLFCALMIDISQVVMLTFVNGFAASAGGNLINGLGMTQYYDFANTSTENGATVEWTKVFMITTVSAIFMFIALCVVVMLAIFLVVRVAVLWFLIILSPFAFLQFIGFKSLNTLTSVWWKHFSNYLMAGPILAFLLWISLLVMSDASSLMTDKMKQEQALAQKESQGNSTADVSPIGNMETFMPYAVSLGMLYGSFAVTKKMASGIGGTVFNKAMDLTKKASGYNLAKSTASSAAKGAGNYIKTKKDNAVGAAKAGLALAGSTAMGKLKGGTALGAVKGAAAGLARAPLATAKRLVTGGTIKDAKDAYKTAKAKGYGGLRTAAGVALGSVGLTAAGGAIASSVKTGIGGGGSWSDKVASEHSNKQIEAQEKKLAHLKGDKGVDALRAKAEDKSLSRYERAAAVKMLGEQNKLGTGDMGTIRDVRKFFDNAKGAQGKIDSSLGEKFAFMKYDTKDPASLGKYQKDLKKGKITMDALDSAAFDDDSLMTASASGLGAKRFAKQMEDAVKKDPTLKDKVAKTLAKMPGLMAADSTTKYKPADFMEIAKTNAVVSGDMQNAFSGVADTDLSNAMSQFMSSHGGRMDDVDLKKLDAAARSGDKRAKIMIQTISQKATPDHLKDLESRGETETAELLVDLKLEDYKDAKDIVDGRKPGNQKEAQKRVEVHLQNFRKMAADPSTSGGHYDRVEAEYDTYVGDLDSQIERLKIDLFGDKHYNEETDDRSKLSSGRMLDKDTEPDPVKRAAMEAQVSAALDKLAELKKNKTKVSKTSKA